MKLADMEKENRFTDREVDDWPSYLDSVWWPDTSKSLS